MDGEQHDDVITAPHDNSDALGRRIVSFVVVAACCAYVFFVVHGATLVLRDSTPTGGDMGAHVWGPAYLRDHLLPNFRLTGWTQDWYAGFPAYTFYMVVPSLAIVGLDVGLFPVDTWWGAALALLAIAGVGVAGWRLRTVPNRMIRVLGWLGLGLALVLSVDVPYNVAFKLVVISGIVAFPAGVWYLLSGLSLRQPGPELGAIVSLAFLMDKSLFHIYGGNIASTMAGEFAFSISITLALFALGSIARGVRTGRHRALSAVLVALTALCHVIPAFFLGVAAVFVILLRPTLRAVVWALPVGFTGALLAAWWYVPFSLRSDYLNDMGWEKLGIVQCNGVDQLSWHEIWRALLPFAPHHYINCPTPAAIGGPAQQPQEFLDPNMLHGKVFFVLAAVGALLSIVMVVRAGLWLTAITVFSALAFTFMPQHRFWNARVLPFYYLGIYLLAGVGVMLLLRAIVLVITGRWGEPNLSVSAAVLGVAAVTMWIVLGMTLRVLPGGKVLAAAPGQTESYQWLYFNSTYQGVALGWAKWNFEGLESKPGSIISVNGVDKVDVSDSKEFFGMIDEMRQVGRDDGCGRAYWEYDGDLNKYGTPMAPMLLPYFTDGCIGSMEGLYFEASSTTPFHFVVQSELSKAPSRPQRFPMVGVEPTDAPQGFKGPWPYRDFDIDQGVRHLQLLGVRYFMTYTPETRTAAEGDDRLTLVGQSGPWRVFRVADSPVVEPLENLPNRWTDVEHEIHSWARPAIEWFDDRTRWDVVNSTDGPAEWPTIRSGDAPVRRRSPAPDLRVSKVVTTDEGISFDVDEVGSPVLVKTSYFPNWEAEGADGPYRVTPNFMVVIPTSKHVTMTYGRTPLEGIAWVLTLLGVIGLFALMRWRWPAFVGAPYEFFGDRPPDDSDESWHTTIDADAVEIDGEELPSPPGFPAPDR